MAAPQLIADIDVFVHDAYWIVRMPAGRAAVVLLIAWLGVLGAVIGSFLNVVVYRLPLGMSVSFPGSHCPVCKHAIRWYDNVPVLGWLWLGGRCRDCRTAISPRYPSVELLCGLLFAGLAWLEVFSDGMNLPQHLQAGDEATAGYLPWLRYAYHLLFACTVLCVGLIDYDGRRTPVRFWGTVMLLGLGLPVGWPELRPLAMGPDGDGMPSQNAWLAGLADGLGGVILGGAFGWLLQPGAIGRPARQGTPAAAIVLLLTGSFLGWQAVGWTVAGGLLLLAAGWLTRGGRSAQFRFPICASFTALGLLFSWRWLAAWQDQWHWPVWLVLGGLAGLIVAVRFAGARRAKSAL